MLSFHVQIMVQNSGECGADFANRINEFVPGFLQKHLTAIDINVQFTSDANGRQTANISVLKKEPKMPPIPTKVKNFNL